MLHRPVTVAGASFWSRQVPFAQLQPAWPPFSRWAQSLLCLLAAALLVSGCASNKKRPVAPPPPPVKHAPPKPSVPPPPPPPKTAVELGVVAGPPVSSLDITPANAASALSAFRTSCKAVLRRRDGSGLTRNEDWRPACDAAVAPDADASAANFFPLWFETVVVGPGTTFDTGYYEPEIEGSRTHIDGYDVPLYRRPPDLIEVDAGTVGGTPGAKRRGRMQDGAFVPYYERAKINGGALADKGLELAWVKDPYEAFFLEIQGSGRLIQPDGTIMRIGYDGQNGRDYTGIGSLMRQRGLIGPGTPYDTSMQGMLAWMRAFPDQARSVMEENKSYVFFREIVGPGPIGALGVPVVGHVSVAADPNFVPLGAPVWLKVDRQEVTGLWVAQDTGGAIKGANRFDTFWGAGILARLTAGGMSARGQALILVPRGTMDRLRGGRLPATAAPRPVVVAPPSTITAPVIPPPVVATPRPAVTAPPATGVAPTAVAPPSAVVTPPSSVVAPSTPPIAAPSAPVAAPPPPPVLPYATDPAVIPPAAGSGGPTPRS